MLFAKLFGVYFRVPWLFVGVYGIAGVCNERRRLYCALGFEYGHDDFSKGTTQEFMLHICCCAAASGLVNDAEVIQRFLCYRFCG